MGVRGDGIPPGEGSKAALPGRYGGAPDGVWLAPGRANLMGEHTDYNEGYVFPFAVPQHVVTAAGRRADGRLRYAPGRRPARSQSRSRTWRPAR